jgi:hypothetical protein
MLSADARFTVASLNRLKDAARKGRRIVVWVGAGLIYPLDTTLQSKCDKHSPEMSQTSQTIMGSRWSTRNPPGQVEDRVTGAGIGSLVFHSIRLRSLSIA